LAAHAQRVSLRAFSYLLQFGKAELVKIILCKYQLAQMMIEDQMSGVSVLQVYDTHATLVADKGFSN
jgi:hypothetical protein